MGRRLLESIAGVYHDLHMVIQPVPTRSYHPCSVITRSCKLTYIGQSEKVAQCSFGYAKMARL